jgi:D-serine deaminase-like pyridoxal phosphate-dependent protein
VDLQAFRATRTISSAGPPESGELCERFCELHLIDGDRIVDTVPTYRGEGHSFG